MEIRLTGKGGGVMSEYLGQGFETEQKSSLLVQKEP